MAEKEQGKREKRVAVAQELVEHLKTTHPELKENDLTAIFSNAWHIVRSTSKKE